MIKKILLHTNGSDLSNRALDYALYLAKKLNASLTAVYVINVKAPKQLEPANVPKEEGREADACLQGTKEKADSEGLEINTKILASRSTTDAIADEAIGGDYDIVVMAPINGGGISKILSKSGSEEILSRISKPVLIVN